MATYTAAAGGGNWNDTATWEEGGGYPGSGDNAVFDSGSGNVTVNVASACLDITCTGYTGTLTLGANLTVYGSLLFVSGMTFTPSTYAVIFAATTTGKTITTGGKDFHHITFDGSGGEWTLQDNVAVSSGSYNKILALTAGTLKLNGCSFLFQYSSSTVVINALTLEIGSGAFGCGSAVQVTTGGTVTITTGSLTTYGISNPGSLTIDGTGTVIITSTGQIRYSRDVTITSPNFDAGTASTVALCGSGAARTFTCSQPIWNFTVENIYSSNKVLLGAALVVQNNVTINYRSGYVTELDLGGYQLTVGGNFTNDDVFTHSNGTVVFNATTTGKTIKTNGDYFYAVTFNGSGGEWTLQDDFTMTRTLAMTLGTLVLNGKTFNPTYLHTVTLGSGFMLTVGTGAFSSVYTSVTVGTGATVTVSTGTFVCVDLTVSGTGVFDCGSSPAINIRRNLTVSSTGFDGGTALIEFTATDGNGTINSTQPLYDMAVGRTAAHGSMTYTLAADLTVENDLTINYRSSYVRVLACGSYTLTIGGDFTNNDTFTCGTGTVVFNDATKTSIISGTGTITFNTLRCLTANKTVKFQQGKTITVSSFDFTGASGQLITLDTDTGSGTFTLSDTTGTNQVEYCDIHRSVATGGATWLAYTTDGNVDGGGNSGWVFSTGVPFDPLMLAGD